MKSSIVFREGMQFDSVFHTDAGGTHVVVMDAKSPLGKNRGPSPKELLLSSIQGCTAMDVAALLKKYKISFKNFQMTADAETTDTHPKVFKHVKLQYLFENVEGDADKIKESVHLSMSKFCGVSAMIAKVCPIHYDIFVDGKLLASGVSAFPES